MLDNIVDKRVRRGMESLMSVIQELSQSLEEKRKNGCEKLKQAEEHYRQLELSQTERDMIDQYMENLKNVNRWENNISYYEGMKDAIILLNELNLSHEDTEK